MFNIFNMFKPSEEEKPLNFKIRVRYFLKGYYCLEYSVDSKNNRWYEIQYWFTVSGNPEGEVRDFGNGTDDWNPLLYKSAEAAEEAALNFNTWAKVKAYNELQDDYRRKFKENEREYLKDNLSERQKTLNRIEREKQSQYQNRKYDYKEIPNGTED